VTSGALPAARWRDPRIAAYGALLAGIAVPVALFVVAGADAGSFGLRGAGGPLVAFSAGVLSFLSPCVLPLVPIYITHLAGSSFDTATGIAPRRITFTHAVAFILGLSAVFVTLGASAGFAGSFVLQHQRALEQGSGLLLLALGALLVPAHTRRSTPVALAMLLVLVALFTVLADLARLGDSLPRMLLLGGQFVSGCVHVAFFSSTCSSDRAVQPRPRRHRIPLRPSGRRVRHRLDPCVGRFSAAS